MQTRYTNLKATIEFREIKRSFTYLNVPVLSLSVHYPHIGLVNNKTAQARINNRIQSQVAAFTKAVSTSLYRQAVSDYKNRQQNDFPFNAFEAVLNYTVTYNQNCYLSMYRDQYEFMGGAHGTTNRSSDTFSLRTGATLPLSSYFQPYQNYRRILLTQILRQADENMRQNPIYFDNYPILIMQNFNEESYYLTPDGIALYFQEYEIAPYSTGIVVFTVPYSLVHWYPTCMHSVPPTS